MKTLTIQQPWASLICAGMKDVENRTWKTPKLPMRILIHSGGKKIPSTLLDEVPEECFAAITNGIAFGWIPPFEEMLYSAIIGYVDVVDIREATDSIWDAGEGSLKWVLKNPRLFDTPIFNVKGQLGLFNYPLDEDDLPPSHEVTCAYPRLEGNQLIFPLGAHFFDYILEGEREIGLAYNEEMKAIFNSDEIASGRYPAKSILLDSPGRQACYDLKQIEIVTVQDENGNPFRYEDIKGNEQFVYEIYFKLGEEEIK